MTIFDRHIFLVLIGGFFIQAQSDAAKSIQSTVGRIVTCSGKVLIRNELDVKSVARQAKPGDYLKEGEVINTSSSGSAKLLLDDKSLVDIGPSSLFNLSRYKPKNGKDREIVLGLPYGTVRASVPNPIGSRGFLRVKTKAATMGVRGTEFVVQSAISTLSNNNKSNVPAPKTEITVIQGKVEVQQAAQVKEGGRTVASPKMETLNAGQKIVADQSAVTPSKAVNLTPSEIKQTVSAVKVEDKTFSQAVTINTSSTSGGSQEKGPDMGSSKAAMAVLQTVLASVTPESIISGPATAGFIGTFGMDSILTTPPPPVVAGGIKRVVITITP